MSFSDFLNTFFNTTFNFIYMTQRFPVLYNDMTLSHLIVRNWIFGWLFCKISNFISHLAIAASVTTMLAIACER